MGGWVGVITFVYMTLVSYAAVSVRMSEDAPFFAVDTLYLDSLLEVS